MTSIQLSALTFLSNESLILHPSSGLLQVELPFIYSVDGYPEDFTTEIVSLNADITTDSVAWYVLAVPGNCIPDAYSQLQGQTKRRDGKSSRVPKASLFAGGKSRGGDDGQPQIKKATFEISKKKEVGVSDLTLLSKVSNEAINENLKKRFEHGEIYVCSPNMPLFVGKPANDGLQTYIGHVLVSVNPFRDRKLWWNGFVHQS